MSQAEQVKSLVDETVPRYGRLDIAVNAAAIVPFKAWDDIDFAEWRRIMAVNLDGVFLLPTTRSSPCARPATAASSTSPPTSSSRHAEPRPLRRVEGRRLRLHPGAARELGKYGITVNSVAPGLTASEGVLASPHAEAFDFVQMLQAIPRRGEADDIAPSVAFLASEEARWVTGQMIVVDGGHTHN